MEVVMIFQYSYQLILEDKKTETRRLIGPDEKLLDNPKRIEANGRTKWQVGHSYAVQPARGKRAVGRIRMIAISIQALGHINAEEALAEGFQTLDAFRQAWIQIHGCFDPELVVWVLTFSREPTIEEKIKAERLNQENSLNRLAQEQWEKLTAVGHELGEWEETSDLKLQAKCSRCGGVVTVSTGKMSIVGYIPLMTDEECLADDPARMEAIEKEWNRRLAKVYTYLLAKGREKSSNRNKIQTISED
jgi:hypothetical protein